MTITFLYLCIPQMYKRKKNTRGLRHRVSTVHRRQAWRVEQKLSCYITLYFNTVLDSYDIVENIDLREID